MSTQFNPVVAKTAKPTVAGILNIVTGSFVLLGVIVLVIMGVFFAPFAADIDASVPFNLGIFFLVIAVPLAAMGIVTVIGGVYALQRKAWGWALAGSVVAVLVSNLMGIASIVLIALSRDEFAN